MTLARAHALAAAGDPGAIAAYQAALAEDPGCADAANNLGVLLRAAGRPAEALACYRRALAAAPDHADAHSNLGRALLEGGQAAAALPHLRRAAAGPRSPADRWHTLGRALQATGALDGARAAYERAARLAPGGAETANNLANVLIAQGAPAQAAALLDAALARHPGHAELRYNRALALLLLGRWREGFADYEARWQARGFPSPARDFGLPRWAGERRPAATLLLHWEQGLGDTIQFARFVAAARHRVGRVALLVQPPLRRLLQGVADVVATDGEALPTCDMQAPLLSLPHLLDWFRPRPLWEGAAGTGWDAANAARWPPSPTPLPQGEGASDPSRIGLAWAGNPAHANDRNRSLPPAALARLLAIPGVAWRNLQLGPRRAELPAPAFAPRDMADTAAAVAGLDRVIAVDTSVAHLAASLGVPTWLLLPHAPDWRWGGAGGATPWYPSMRLFRQPSPGDWDTPIAAIAAALREGRA